VAAVNFLFNTGVPLLGQYPLLGPRKFDVKKYTYKSLLDSRVFTSQLLIYQAAVLITPINPIHIRI